MYTNKRNNNKTDIFTYIDGSDIYNSGLLKKLKDTEFTKKYYILNNTDKRSDLISESLYGTAKNESFVSIINPDYTEEKTDFVAYIPELDNELGELL